MCKEHDKLRISVIVPAYNAEKTLARCVDSLLAQTHTDLEILLVDDGSTDGTAEICLAYAAQDARVRVLRKENGGVSSARNAGLAAARGELIGFTDADDYCAPHMYEELARTLTHTHADISQCDHRTVSLSFQASGEEERPAVDIGQIRRYSAGEAVKSLLAQHSFHPYAPLPVTFVVWDKLYKREVLTGVRFDEGIHMGEDTLFVAEALLKAGTVSVTSGQGYFHVYFPDSLAHSTGYAKVRSHLQLPDAYAEKILRLLPALAAEVLGARAYMYVAIYNRLLGERESFSGEERAALTEDLRSRFRGLKADAHYKAVDSKLRTAIFCALHLPFVNQILARLFRARRARQNRALAPPTQA
jgi:glycosyltransferase involved in cell wall biosynthesis